MTTLALYWLTTFLKQMVFLRVTESEPITKVFKHVTFDKGSKSIKNLPCAVVSFQNITTSTDVLTDNIRDNLNNKGDMPLDCNLLATIEIYSDINNEFADKNNKLSTNFPTVLHDEVVRSVSGLRMPNTRYMSSLMPFTLENTNSLGTIVETSTDRETRDLYYTQLVFRVIFRINYIDFFKDTPTQNTLRNFILTSNIK